MSISAAEYAPFYSGYVKNVTMDVLQELRHQAVDFTRFIQDIPEAKTHFAYAAEKWTVAGVIGHLLDTERVMAYRALCFARHNGVAQPGFDENVFAQNANYDDRTLGSLATEFQLLRNCNLLMFESFSAEALQNSGVANGKAITVRALLFVIAGHLIHHRNILEERYL